MTDTKASSRRQACIEPKLAKHYDSSFYDSHGAKAVASARIYLKFLWQFFQPASVLDVGCGRGAWLKVCHELGSTRLWGFDGDWNNQEAMIDSAIIFQSIDLNRPFSVPEKVELAMTLEVAEHLEPSTGNQFVRSLTEASDTVLFGAAYTKQGGTNHINERRHSYWAHLFGEHGFVPFDLFRPVFWGDENVAYWYRQNSFLYLRKGSASWQKVGNCGFRELVDTDFMDCIHPELYEFKTSHASFKCHITDFLPSIGRTIRRRLFNFPPWRP
jgi:SAM-dependent methyltransferase